MNKLLTLAILTVFIGFRVTKGDYSTDDIDSYRKYIQETREDIDAKLKNFQNDNFAAVISIENFLKLTKERMEHKLQQNLTEALNNTRDSVETAMAQGRDSEHCLFEALQRFEQLNEDVPHKLIACAWKIERQFVSQRGFVDIIIEEAKNVLHQLNMLIPSCFSHYSIIVGCVANKVENAMRQVKSFNDNYKLAVELRDTIIEDVRRNASLCYKEQEQHKWEQIEIVTKSAQNCIEGM